MRIRAPTSRASIGIRFSAFDMVIAGASPYLALYLRDALILSTDIQMAVLYCSASAVFSLSGFALFQVHDAIPRYFSIGDVVSLGKAVLVGELMTAIVLFTFTRLDGVPRSVPAIHALILGAGLVAARGLTRFADRNRHFRGPVRGDAAEHMIVVGLDDVSVFLMKFLETRAPRRQRIIALLDPEPRWIGRSVKGVRVFGPPSHLTALIEEFSVHGVRTDRVLISNETGALLDRELREVRKVCAQRNLKLSFVQEFLRQNLDDRAKSSAPVPAPPPVYRNPQHIRSSAYFRWKGRIEFVVALGLLLLLWPLWLLAVILAFLDVGSPTLFWQQRVGLHGRAFQLYKIRTLRAAFDRYGQRTPEERRLSWAGCLLRQTRLDELAQLLNVLVGDMSLIGPRPLLPEDQPPDPSVRLMVRPGITGWAQVNGGTLLTSAEKEELDAWYIRHASFWLDLSIVGMTLCSFVRGDCRSEVALAKARADREATLSDNRKSVRDRPAARVGPIEIEDGAPAGSKP